MNPKSANCMSLRVPLADLDWLRTHVAPGRKLSDVVREILSKAHRDDVKKTAKKAAKKAAIQ